MTWSPSDDSDAFVTCRTLGHSWDDIPGQHGRVEELTRIVLRCTRCKTQRSDFIGPNTGEVEARTYKYPPGYQHKHGGDAPRRADWRLAYIKVLKIAGRRR